MKKRLPPGPSLKWRNLPDGDFFLVAKSYHNAARKLADSLNINPGPLAEFDVCPVLSMYRRALEMQLKVMILGEGGNFLAAKPDELAIHKTHSVSWLAQFVCQIIVAVKWEKAFCCDGIRDLTDFKSFVEEINAIDPAFHAFRCPVNLNVHEFAAKLDALLVLLESTADALAATWDLQMGDAPLDTVILDDDFNPTIQ